MGLNPKKEIVLSPANLIIVTEGVVRLAGQSATFVLQNRYIVNALLTPTFIPVD